MNQKIDLAQKEYYPREKEFTSGFFPSLILLTVAVLIMVAISEYLWKGYHGSRVFAPGTPLCTLFPAKLVSGNTIANGIQAFSGKALTPTDLSFEILILATILVIYIVIPTVFFFNWRRRRIEIKSVSTINPLSFSSIIYALSIILTLSVSATAITSAIMNHSMRRGLEHTQAIQSNKDEIINDLVRISLDTYQYRLLPKDLGGGQGKYIGFALASEQAKTRNGVYTASVSDNIVTIKAQSLQYPSGIISMKINEQGQTNFQFEGVFN